LTDLRDVGIFQGMGDLSFSKKIALRYLWSKRSEAFISIISIVSVVGVAIGVMVLSIVMAVMTGFEHELRDKIVGTDSHIVVTNSTGGRIDDWTALSDRIARVEGIASVAPYTFNQVLMRSSSRSVGVLVRGIEKGSASATQVSSYIPANQSLETLFDPEPIVVTDSAGEERDVTIPGILIGRSLARSLGVFVGTPISVLSPQLNSTPFGLVPRFRRFVVVGTYSSGLIEYESGVAYVDMKQAQKFFGFDGGVSGLEVRVDSIDDASRVAEAIRGSLGDQARFFSVRDWTETNRPLWEAIQLEKRVYFIVLLLIIVMASFSIVTTLIMIVLEKRKDIAIMKTMGATTKSISGIFRIQGAVIGGVGTLSGLVLGLVGCFSLKHFGFPIDERIFQMSTLPIHIDPLNFIVVGFSAFLICVVATMYPAWRATQLEPSDVLRHD
jgi:lipoprotein-releasing system permease protein